jgi:hypothetical protein
MRVPCLTSTKPASEYQHEVTHSLALGARMPPDFVNRSGYPMIKTGKIQEILAWSPFSRQVGATLALLSLEANATGSKWTETLGFSRGADHAVQNHE